MGARSRAHGYFGASTTTGMENIHCTVTKNWGHQQHRAGLRKTLVVTITDSRLPSNCHNGMPVLALPLPVTSRTRTFIHQEVAEKLAHEIAT